MYKSFGYQSNLNFKEKLRYSFQAETKFLTLYFTKSLKYDFKFLVRTVQVGICIIKLIEQLKKSRSDYLNFIKVDSIFL